MPKFIIQPHGRLQEWIAHEKGYFHAEGLDYEFGVRPTADRERELDASGKVAEIRSGAFESYSQAGGNKGVKSDISCACHWAVNQASAQRIGTMWGKSYVVTPGGVMVPPDSPIRRPEHLADREIAVGYHSGSHFTTIQALDPFIARDRIKLKFVGMPWARVRRRRPGRGASNERVGPDVPDIGATRFSQSGRYVVHDRVHVSIRS